MTVKKGSTIYAKTEDDTLVCKDGFAWLKSVSGSYKYKTGANFEAGDYKCGKSVTSKNAGKECSSSSDCKTSQSDVKAVCACSYGSSKSICGILTGNSEWQDYFEALVKYYDETKNCQNAQDFQAV